MYCKKSEQPLKLKCTPKRKLYTLEYEPVHYFTLLIRDIQKAAKLVRSPRRKEIKHVTKTIYIQVCTGRLVVTETHSKNAVPRNVGKFD